MSDNTEHTGSEINYLGRILFVDDEKEIRELVNMHLTHEGLSSVCVATVDEAISALKCERFQLVIVDWKLSDGSGKRVLEESNRRYPETPVLIVSGVAPQNENV